MKVIVIDKRDSFLQDLNIRMLIDDRNVEVVETATDLDNLSNLVYKCAPEVIAIADNAFSAEKDWVNTGYITVGYATTKSSNVDFEAYGIASLGYIKTTEHLLNILELPLPSAEKKNTKDIPIGKKNENIPQTPMKKSEYSHDSDTITEKKGTSPAPQSVERHDRTNIYSPPKEPQYISSSEKSQQTSTPTVKSRLSQATATRNYEDARSILSKNLEEKKKKAKVVTVYAAKGGVGKTTISTELASYLSRMSIGRDYLRVCIVDYNIDFGDVQTTLNYDAAGENLTYWAAEVRERLERGESPEDIIYTRQEIESRLQRQDETGLYALIAPITHEDSMDINNDELEIILKSIINNGEFDFVICDTGNNTRDSSVLALEAADVVLLIVTQDVSTASCNSAFLSTMKKIEFDTEKIKLIVNAVMPYKYTQVAVQELEDMFPYQCLARIKRSPEVVKANNCSEPIVFVDQNHDFTKGIKRIADYLTGQNSEVSTQKKSIFSKIFGKK